ncbi:hypothetical protein VB711_06870 [Cronbergia sp. UHCC 0137]|uniref:hypothetical protein n=1 Tax=Cronbergia sp. UHCC 0137 TaxID=3110239 RepID=UPI002B210C19|nr:hypothetical protein [Cronbergia sp. UHCC 0137]MEA5617560.1 hypothetical protein [Cronbergia sp. UHCC 0137]
MPALKLLPGAISEIIAASANSRTLTLADRYGLMAAILDESLEEEEEQAINRLLRFVIKGRIKVVDTLSSDL